MSRASELEYELDIQKKINKDVIATQDRLHRLLRTAYDDNQKFLDENAALEAKLKEAQSSNNEWRLRARYENMLENMTIIDPSIRRFWSEEHQQWNEHEIRRAADWIRGHDAVHSFDQHDDEAVSPVVFPFGGGDAA